MHRSQVKNSALTSCVEEVMGSLLKQQPVRGAHYSYTAQWVFSLNSKHIPFFSSNPLQKANKAQHSPKFQNSYCHYQNYTWKLSKMLLGPNSGALWSNTAGVWGAQPLTLHTKAVASSVHLTWYAKVLWLFILGLPSTLKHNSLQPA